MRILVGTSGWQYDDWKGRLYPTDLPKRGWLPHFSAHFPTVEVNNTFYRLPLEHTFDSWRVGSAEDFVFAVKANRFITHLKRLKEPREPVTLFWERAKRLAPKLGPVLFQLPPNFHVDLGRLRAVLEVLPDEMRPAFEFRHETWRDDRVHELLDGAGAALVLPDAPGSRVPNVVTSGWSYVRFHKGRPTTSGYARDKLRRWADRIASLDAREVWVYFNNDPGGAAVRDAIALTDLLRDRCDHEVDGPTSKALEAAEEDASAR